MRFWSIACIAVTCLGGCTPPPDPAPEEPAVDHSPVAGRTRVLYLEGAPRWEYRYLSAALVRDSSLDVHCVLLSADPEFPQLHSLKSENPKFQESAKLAPGTLEELLEYDVVILGDVSPGALAPGSAARLKAFVEVRGRGLVVLTGARHALESWKGTELELMLPVEALAEVPGPDSGFRYRLTAAGKASPLTALGLDGAGALELWEDRDQGGDGLPAMHWAATTRARPDARALVETTSGIPLFVTREPGHGRVFFSATDESWRWRFRSGDNPWFYPFWRGVIDWAHRGK